MLIQKGDKNWSNCIEQRTRYGAWKMIVREWEVCTSIFYYSILLFKITIQFHKLHFDADLINGNIGFIYVIY